MSTGEKVSPSEIEARIIQDSLFENALVVGNGKPSLAAVLVLNENRWQRLAGKLALSADELNVEAVRNAVLKRLEERLAPLARHAQVRAVHLTLEPWTAANGLLTPTLKVKRAPLEAKYASEIAKLYLEHAPPLSARRQTIAGD